MVLKSRKAEIETALEDIQTAGRGRPINLNFNTICYADAGMCQITHFGEISDRGAWQDREAPGWIAYRHVDGRKRLVTCYAVECKNKYLVPRAVELAGCRRQ